MSHAFISLAKGTDEQENGPAGTGGAPGLRAGSPRLRPRGSLRQWPGKDGFVCRHGPDAQCTTGTSSKRTVHLATWPPPLPSADLGPRPHETFAPRPPPQLLATATLLSDSANVTRAGTSYKWNPTAWSFCDRLLSPHILRVPPRCGRCQSSEKVILSWERNEARGPEGDWEARSRKREIWREGRKQDRPDGGERKGPEREVGSARLREQQGALAGGLGRGAGG